MKNSGQVVTGLVMWGLIVTFLFAAGWIAIEVTDKRQQDTTDYIYTEETTENVAPIPEPTTMLMFGSGCAFWWATRRKK